MGRNKRKREKKSGRIDNGRSIGKFQQAILDGSTRQVADFILGGIQVNRRKRYGNTALHQACTVKDNADVIRLLANAGANVNTRNNDGDTPLHQVVKAGISNDAQQLIVCGADVNIKDQNGDTPLHILCLQVTQMLCWSVMELEKRPKTLKSEDKTDEKRPTPEQEQDKTEAPAETLTQTLTLAGEKNYDQTMENVRVLLKAGAEVNVFNSTGETALHVASRSSSRVLVEMLLRHGAELEVRDKKGYTPLLTSCHSYLSENNALPTACLLVEHGADVTVTTDVTRKTCLHLLAASSRFYYRTLMELVVEKGCPLDARDETGSTAMHITCKNSHRGHVTVMLSMHPDVNVFDDKGRTAFSYFDQNIFDAFETSPVLRYLQTDLDFRDYEIDKEKCTFEGLVYMRWAECIKPESVWPDALYTDYIKDPLATCQIILSSQPVLSLNVSIKTSKIKVCTATTSFGMKRARRPDLRILNSEEIPSLKVFSRAVIRRSICPGRSLLPLIKSFLSQVNLPRSVSEFIFLYEEAMTVFRNDGYDLGKLFPYS